jgi:hypothetical protein
MFEAGPLRAIEELFARRFEELPEPYPGIRAYLTIAVPFFAPMTFYGIRVADDGGEVVEIVDITFDEEYEWDSPGDPGLH